MKVYYINNLGQRIDFIGGNYKMETTDLFSYKESYDLTNNRGNSRIDSFYRSVTIKKIAFTTVGKSLQDCYTLANEFYNITSADVIKNVQGRIYYGDYFVECNIFASTPSQWEYMINQIDFDVEVLIPNPNWVKELRLEIESSGGIVDITELDFPFDFPFDFPMSSLVNRYIDNPTNQDVNFRMEIHGQANQPVVQIGDNIHGLRFSLNEGEYALIDSLRGTITRFLINGTSENIFHWRLNQNSIFTKIPPGQSLVKTEQRTIITIYIERSAPEWTS